MGGSGATLLSGVSASRADDPPRPGDLARAARLLAVRSRREAGGAFVGGYRSAFRGVGIEFEESRPYVPGDDVRFLDGNVMARTGVPYVKRFREERDQTVHLAVDLSGSMAFGSSGHAARTKGALAARVAALVAVAALRAGDRVGLYTFDEEVRAELPPARGGGQLWEILERLLAAPGELGGPTGLAASLARVHASVRRRSLVFVISDFRDEGFFDPSVAAGRGLARPGTSPRVDWVALARHHDLVAVLVYDPREDALPRAGTLRLADPERPGRRLWLRTGSRLVRDRYRDACEVRRRAVVRRLRSDGASVLTLCTDRDPLHLLFRFFVARAGETSARGIPR